jgi:hypothetical protein
MFKKIIFSLLLAFTLFSCKKEEQDVMLIQKMEQKNKLAFDDINKAWEITVPPSSPEVQSVLANWKNWQSFVSALKQKPKTSISAFKLKVTNLSNQADSLYLQVPQRFSEPQVKSRLVALHTKLQSLDTYFSLDIVPLNKIKPIIVDINKELNAFYMQCEELIIKSKIPTEIGEKEMIKALDTTRNAKKMNFDEEEEKQILEKDKEIK